MAGHSFNRTTNNGGTLHMGDSYTNNGGTLHTGDRYTYYELGDNVRQFFGWLSPLDYQKRQKNMVESTSAATTHALLEVENVLGCPELTWWQEGSLESPRSLWCHGNPGVGKTFLASSVIDQLWQRQESDPTIAVAWIYCDRKEQNTITPDNLAGCLLKQLVRQQLVRQQLRQQQYRDGESEPRFSKRVEELYKMCKGGHEIPVLADILRVLQSEISQFTKTYIVIDALDECTQNAGTYAKFEDVLLVLRDAANVMATSCNEIAWGKSGTRRDTRVLEVRANDKVVRAYVEYSIARGLSKDQEVSEYIKKDAKVAKRIVDGIIARAQGLVLYAKLDVDQLYGKPTADHILSTLKEPHKGLMDNRYEEAFKRIQDREQTMRQLALRVLLWLSHSFRCLTVAELQDALAVGSRSNGRGVENPDNSGWRPTEKEIKEICEGLVVIKPQSNQIGFFHDTAYQYFRHNVALIDPDPHAALADICLRHASRGELFGRECETDDDMKKRLRDYPFFGYVAQHWGDHARLSQKKKKWSKGKRHELEEKIFQFISCEHRLASLAQGRHIQESGYGGGSQSYTRDVRPLQVASSFGLESVVRTLLRASHSDGVDGSGGTAFHSAAEKGYHKILKVLLDRKAATETATIRDGHGRTALHLASAQGHHDAVSLLLEQGFKIDERDSSLRTALHLAAQYGHMGTVEVLLEHSPDTTAKDRQGHTAWQLAVAHKHEDVARLLESLPGSNNHAYVNSLVLFQPPASETDITGGFMMIRPSPALTEAWVKQFIITSPRNCPGKGPRFILDARLWTERERIVQISGNATSKGALMGRLPALCQRENAVLPSAPYANLRVASNGSTGSELVLSRPYMAQVSRGHKGAILPQRDAQLSGRVRKPTPPERPWRDRSGRSGPKTLKGGKPREVGPVVNNKPRSQITQQQNQSPYGKGEVGISHQRYRHNATSKLIVQKPLEGVKVGHPDPPDDQRNTAFGRFVGFYVLGAVGGFFLLLAVLQLLLLAHVRTIWLST